MGKILLVDDEEALRLLLGRQLRRAGHEVVTAEDGQAAAEILEQNQFDVIVSDMKMPRLDGMGLLAQSAQLAPESAFIILTGHGSLESALEAFKTGRLFDYLLKPLEDIHELDVIVNRAVERNTLRAENNRLLQELESKVASLEEARTRLQYQAERDGLTGLLNHRTIHLQLNDLLDDATAHPVSIILMDMDDFKLINDTYGHLLGDRVLRHLCTALSAACPDSGLIGRCGGDEFMIVLPNTDLEAAANIAVKVKTCLASDPFTTPDGSRIPLGLCFGVTDTNNGGTSSASLISAADSALYEGKSQGGDRVTLHLVNHSDYDHIPNKNTFDVLDSLVTAIDNKDHYTKRHSEDMTEYAMQIAQALELSDDTLKAVRVAGLLHDIGKIGVPDFILRKPGKLTASEYEVMKGHVTLSTLIIHGLPRLNDIMDAVAHHHERWDGKGYPKGIAGTQIPLLGRVMAIADAFSAMTLDRPYRAAMPIETALEEVEKGAGSQFDPELAQVFVAAVRDRLAHAEVPSKKAA